jgi:ketosteroid isomerase-like protein
MVEREAVLKANRAFYRAFESLDIEQMEKVWLKEPTIICIHPGWHRLVGWGPVMESWERIFEAPFEMSFELTQPAVFISGDLAIVVVQENLTQKGANGSMRVEVLATNVYQRCGYGWYMIVHHGSPIAIAGSTEPPLQ